MMLKLLRQLRQQWRVAEMRLLFLALLVSVTAITSVGFFTDRADQAMNTQATRLMGGDLVISSSRPIDPEYRQIAEGLGLKHARMISFPSMVSLGDAIQLARVKAVSAGYPLTGAVETSDAVAAAATQADMGELKGNVIWAEPRLFVSLQAKTGASVQLGNSRMTLAKVISKMPDQGANAFQFAPKLLMQLDNLAETGLLTPASRARFSLLFAGDSAQIQALNKWLEPRLKPGERIRTLQDGMPSVNQALERGKRFLNMAALLSVILAGAAIALTSYSLNQREMRPVAVLKTLGASRRQISHHYLLNLLTVTLMAALLGAILGYVLQLGLGVFLQDMIGERLPAAGFMPVFSGLFAALIMALGFSAPQLLYLVTIPPVSILQNQAAGHAAPYRIGLAAILAGTFLLMWLQTGDLRLSLFLLPGTALAIGLFWLIANLLLKLLKNVKQRAALSGLNLPKANPRIALLVMVFGIGLFSLLLLTAIRTDLIDRWQQTLPADAPNHFLINIQPDEVEPLQQLFAQRGASAPLYPMIRGRLIAINEKSVSADDYDGDRAQRLAAREFNISSIAELPDSNTITRGKWFAPGETQGISVEQGIAETLGFQLGDTLTFDIAGQLYKQKITSLRDVRWDSMQPNFFVLGAPTTLDNQPRTFITSLYVPPEDRGFMPELIHQYPSITDIDINAIMQQIRELINKAALAVQAIFLFTLVAGLVVLFAALQSQKAERRKEMAILKSIGASRSHIKRSLLTEFTLIGALAGFIGGLLALIASNVAAWQLFELKPSLNPLLIIAGMLSGAVLVGVAGYLNMRPLLKITPVALFQSQRQ